ncbi:MAG TPA: KH domain-containing protein [Methanomicrobiales archaeon]|nr:KH domain-containing protein [Methanomicrobiales archaeon]
MTREEVRVSQDRIGVLIGKGGATKRSLEEKTGSRVTVDSKEGIVAVEGEDAEGVISAAEVVRAIGRGFSPERAFVLLEDEDLLLDVIELTALADTPQQMDRIRGRVIGKDGRSREQIEDMTGTAISVHGKTVAIIGGVEQSKTARTAVEMLLTGVPHEAVFAFLDRKKKEAKQDLLGSYY